jgi:hypothetical protein
MDSNQGDVAGILSEQIRHQIRVTRRRLTWWIPLIFVIGLGVSILGLIPSIAEFQEEGSLTPALFIFGFFAIYFGSIVILSLLGPFPIRPRIVPYFARELGVLWGPTMVAFPRGRGLYGEIVALEQLAGSLGVTPLSRFGFAYDHYEQEVTWHPAREGLRTAEALRQGLGAHLAAAHDVGDDLEALTSVLRMAADQGVDFSLVLRLHAKDSMQVVCTREGRQGGFW